MTKLDILLMPSSVEAIAYDVADILLNAFPDLTFEGEEIFWAGLAYVSGHSPHTAIAAFALDPRDLEKMWLKVVRILEGGRAREERRTKLAWLWNWARFWLAGIGILLLPSIAKAVCDLAGYLLLGPGEPTR